MEVEQDGKIMAEGYVAAEPASYEMTITHYDPRVANQTILFSWSGGALGLQPDEEADQGERKELVIC